MPDGSKARLMLSLTSLGCGFGLALLSPAGLQAIALAVHLQNVDMVRQPVEQRSGEPLRAEHRSPHSSKGRLLVTITEPRS
jgi:hypothetical protein